MTEAVDDLSAAVFERAALDATHLRAMHDALRWTRQHRLFEGHAATATRACVNAATYARLCAPPRASARQLELATTFTVLFFWLDDLEPAALAAVIAGRWSQV
ncbi:MAG: hypothetical protein IAG13_30640, partial [Deltaproteobacteria bacterium]|nr:hypothetical protein [Nannocystaceae bacterium]